MQLDFQEQRALFRQQITQRYQISEQLYDDTSRQAVSLCHPFEAARGDYLQRQGKIAQFVYWIIDGVTRNGFVTENGTDVTIRFATEGWNANAPDDLLAGCNGKPAAQFIKAETTVRGFRAEWADVCRLKDSCPITNEYYLKALEYLVTQSARRIYAFAGSSTQERLAAFRMEYPGLEQRISQRLLASYLGVTQSYLSRILGEN